MRKDRRRDRRRESLGKDEKGFSLRNTLYISGIIIALGIIAFFVTIMIYNNNLEKLYSDLETKEIGEITIESAEELNEIAEASMNLGKTAEELENEIKETSVENEEASVVDADVKKEETVEVVVENSKEEDETQVAGIKEEIVEESEEETKVELKFISPVEGEVLREYAKDKLVYSETLKEWVTHTGVDIKAEKTTVVKATESGTVTAIKNDPRYGITVIIEHADGYETRYANLLTAEFVSIGENIEKGKTIGTVGNTGAFEILDDYHLHFELLKDGEYQDPTIYINE